MAEWFVSPHAGEQMVERDIAREELMAMLTWPDKTIPDPKGEPDCRYFAGRGLIAVVNIATHQVITVGYDGASHQDWQGFTAPEVAAPPRRFVRRQRQRREETQAGPVAVRSVLDGVTPGVAAEVRETLCQLGLDFRAVRVVSPTWVEIDPQALSSTPLPHR